MKMLLASMAGVAMLMVFCCCGGVSPSPSTGTSTDEEPTKYGDADDADTRVDAIEYGREAVRERLKYPHDATFDWFPDAFKNELGLWVVVGTVKAKNGFGAELTHEYRAALSTRKECDTWMWKTHLVMLGEEVLYFDEDVPEAQPTEEELAAEKAKREEEIAAAKAARERELELAGKREQRRLEAIEAKRESEFRTWTDSTGSFQVEARLDSYANGKVTLEKRDRTIVSLPASELSTGDQGFIQSKFK